MARRCHEQLIVESFARFLHKTTGRTWTPSPDEVPNPTNSKKYDCEFTSDGCRPIAADVFALYPLGSDQRVQGDRHKIIDKLTGELQNHGVGGLHIQTPFPEKKHVDAQWYKKTAREIRDAVTRDPNAQTFEVDGVTARRCGGLEEPIFFGHNWVSMHQPPEAAGYPLAQVLRDKKHQVDVAGHDRILIGTVSGMPVSLEDVTSACAIIDFSPLLTIDRIYFDASCDEFRLVYDRQAWEAMECGRLPSSAEERRLVTSWIEARMSFHWPSGLELALRISWNEGSTEWLSAGGRELLKLESDLLLRNCEWTTPKAYYEIHCGPVPLIGDGRRRVQPIAVA